MTSTSENYETTIHIIKALSTLLPKQERKLKQLIPTALMLIKTDCQRKSTAKGDQAIVTTIFIVEALIIAAAKNSAREEQYTTVCMLLIMELAKERRQHSAISPPVVQQQHPRPS